MFAPSAKKLHRAFIVLFLIYVTGRQQKGRMFFCALDSRVAREIRQFHEVLTNGTLVLDLLEEQGECGSNQNR
jgi:hypothetical protein